MRHILPDEGWWGTSKRRPAMARAEAASASIRSDSIKGLAQSIAKPAYRRLLTAEPALRRAVPVLIIAFLLTICVGAVVQILEHRRQLIAAINIEIEAVAELMADRIERAVREARSDLPPLVQGQLDKNVPQWATAPGRRILVSDT